MKNTKSRGETLFLLSTGSKKGKGLHDEDNQIYNRQIPSAFNEIVLLNNLKLN